MSTYFVRAICTRCGATLNETPTFESAKALDAVITNVRMSGVLQAGRCKGCGYSTFSDINWAVRFPILRDGTEVNNETFAADVFNETKAALT